MAEDVGAETRDPHFPPPRGGFPDHSEVAKRVEKGDPVERNGLALHAFLEQSSEFGVTQRAAPLAEEGGKRFEHHVHTPFVGLGEAFRVEILDLRADGIHSPPCVGEADGVAPSCGGDTPRGVSEQLQEVRVVLSAATL